ncbi:bidirectional hydrogenase complex protein HoxE [Limnospira platensis]|uniref:bidirectional hydrogenase complex protein HoxE n=1 Tax=Limnospira platensis TaxID=118562 RepID=UPI003D6F9382
MPSPTETSPKSAKSKAASNHPSGDKRFKVLDITMKRSQYSQDALIEVLHKAQEAFGYLEEDVLIYVARQLQLPLSQVYGVATFYHLFSLKPSGAHTCVVCLGTACYVKGSGEVLAALEEKTGIKSGETTPDGQISIVTARCIGACGIAPAAVFDGKVAGQQTPEMAVARLQKWQGSAEA